MLEVFYADLRGHYPPPDPDKTVVLNKVTSTAARILAAAAAARVISGQPFSNNINSQSSAGQAFEPLEPKDLFNTENLPVISNRGNGAPYLPEYPGIGVSISHSGGRIAVCCTDGLAAGIDIEVVRPMSERILRRAFAPAELSFVMNQPIELRDKTFYILWTRKEALLKAAGIESLFKALSIPLTEASGGLEALKSPCLINGSEWSFLTLYQKDCVISVCSEDSSLFLDREHMYYLLSNDACAHVMRTALRISLENPYEL